MNCVWAAAGPMTVRDVHEALLGDRKIAYTTVLTTLQRMARKGLLRQERAERAHRYTAVATRGEMFAELLNDALGVVDGDPAVYARFVGALDSEERAALREALDNGTESPPERA
jgi:predicted transcriptional regulator